MHKLTDDRKEVDIPGNHPETAEYDSISLKNGLAPNKSGARPSKLFFSYNSTHIFLSDALGALYLLPAVAVAKCTSAVHTAGAVNAPLIILARDPLVDISAAAAVLTAAAVAEDAALGAFIGCSVIIRVRRQVAIYRKPGIFINVEL